MENHRLTAATFSGESELNRQYVNWFMFGLSALVFVFYGARGIIELVTLEPPVVWLRAIPALLTATAMIPVLLLSRNQKIRDHWAGFAYTGIVLLLFCNWIWLFYLEPDVWQFVRLIAVMVVLGLGTRRMALWLSLIHISEPTRPY